jgi:nucleoid-associated protein YgaU
MTDTPRRVFGVLCVMVAVWTATYWLYEPAAWEPKVTYGETPTQLVIPETPLPRMDPLAQPITLAPPPAAAAPEPAPQPEATPPQQPTVKRRRVEPPAFREYTVQRGDSSLEVIAQKELGDRRYWRAIAEANPFLTPDKLYAGRTVLKIPLDPGNIQGRIVEEEVPAPASPSPPTPKPKPPEPAVEYTTGSGDTLSGIAKQFYGDPNLWRVIYEANRAVLADPDRLPSGTKIQIPPRPAKRGG